MIFYTFDFLSTGNLMKNYCLSIIDQLQLLLVVNQKKLRNTKTLVEPFKMWILNQQKSPATNKDVKIVGVKKSSKKLINKLWEKKWGKNKNS